MEQKDLHMRLECSGPKNGKASYLDGCILAALGLKRQGSNADIICFITHDISKEDKKKLEVVFDKVMYGSLYFIMIWVVKVI